LDFRITLCLPTVCFAKTEDPNAVIGFAKAEYAHSTFKVADRHVPSLSVFLPLILVDKRGLEFELLRTIERQIALVDIALIFGRVIRDAHQQIVRTICRGTQLEYSPPWQRTCDRS
jgi:hypothetical protein